MPPSPQDPKSIELDAIVKALRLAAKPHETPKETQSRLEREEAEAAHQRQKDLMITKAVLCTVGVVTVVCIVVLFIPGIPPESSKWATTLLTMVVSAGLGHMAGKNSR